MPGFIAKNCSESDMGSRGDHFQLEFYIVTPWLHTLLKYSEESLTRFTDRVPALLGMVSASQATSEWTFDTNFGIWKKRLVDELLWYRLSSFSEGESIPLPSWAWAATDGKKGWILMDFRTAHAEPTTPNSQITTHNSQFKAHKTHKPRTLPPLTQFFLRHHTA